MSNTTLNLSDATFNFVNPATQTPLFIAEWITCAYPVSDLYASSPRYLYYALLVLALLTQWHSWLANVFLGAAASQNHHVHQASGLHTSQFVLLHRLVV